MKPLTSVKRLIMFPLTVNPNTPLSVELSKNAGWWQVTK